MREIEEARMSPRILAQTTGTGNLLSRGRLEREGPSKLNLSLEYVKNEISVRNPSGNVAWQVRYMNLEFRRDA